MLGLQELDIVLNPASSDSEVLSALSRLRVENLNEELIAGALLRLKETVSIQADLAQELEDLGRFAVDCSGTGGSGQARFNTSTSVAFVLAAAGFKVAKFGARAASGNSGSFDFLDCLGFGKELPLSQVADALSVCGLAFIFAPLAYPRLRELAPLRKQLPYATIFNYLGPLLNPVYPCTRLMGVSSSPVHELLARYLCKDGKTERALLVTSADNLDEFSYDSANKVSLIDDNRLAEFLVDPAEIAVLSGIAEKAPLYSAARNAETFLKIANGQDSNSSAYRLVLLNSAASLFVLKACSGIDEGIAIAADLIAQGSVAETLATCRRFYEKIS